MIVVERDVEAGAAQLWSAVADPVSWPQWTTSMTSVELLDEPLGPGVRARVVQPRLPPTVWTVTEFVPGESFVWTASSGGVTTVASHTVAPRDESHSRLVLGISQRGPLAPVARLLLGGLMRRYVGLEADGLAAAARAAAS